MTPEQTAEAAERVIEAFERAAWRPIETAPQGVAVLVFAPKVRAEPYIGSAQTYRTAQWWARGVGCVRPTHWMPIPPLPEPPK